MILKINFNSCTIKIIWTFLDNWFKKRQVGRKPTKLEKTNKNNKETILETKQRMSKNTLASKYVELADIENLEKYRKDRKDEAVYKTPDL